MVALAALAAPAYAADGVLIVQRTTNGGTATESQIQVEPQRLRAEVPAPTGGAQVVIFDGPKQTMWMVDHARKTYTEMTKADVDRLRGQLNAAMAQMQEQLKNLPPAQRAQIEAVMKGRGMAPTQAPQIDYKRAGTDKAGKWTCQRYEGFENGQKTSELCTVEPKTLGLALSDFAVAKQIASFVEGLLPASSTQMLSLGTLEDRGVSGIPVKSLYGSGANQVVTEVLDLRRETFQDSLFTIPQGYTRQAMPGMPGAPAR
jgi:hypothetical protein